jgi:hypothetical protein
LEGPTVDPVRLNPPSDEDEEANFPGSDFGGLSDLEAGPTALNRDMIEEKREE